MREAGFRMTGATVGQVRDCVLDTSAVPRSIDGPWGVPRALEDGTCRRGVQRDFTRPGQPVETTCTESWNGRVGEECLKPASLRLARRGTGDH